MATLIRGGTVVTAERSFRADVLCDGGLIREIGPDIAAPAGARIVVRESGQIETTVHHALALERPFGMHGAREQGAG